MPLVPYVEDSDAIMDHVLNGRKGPIKPNSSYQTVKMSLVPYVEDVDAIMDHVLNGRKGPIKPSKEKPTTPPPPVQIKLVSPIQQTLEMAQDKIREQQLTHQPIQVEQTVQQYRNKPWYK